MTCQAVVSRRHYDGHLDFSDNFPRSFTVPRSLAYGFAMRRWIPE